MKASDLKPGMKFRFEITGKVFTIGSVTETNISWWLGFTHHNSGFGKNRMKMNWTSIAKFQKSMDDGYYTIIL